MLPDHGHRIPDDTSRIGNPGYHLPERIVGLAELRGLERRIAHAFGTSSQSKE